MAVDEAAAEPDRFAEDTLRATGAGALELQVERDNHEAIAFYTKLGLHGHDRMPMSKLIK